MRLTMRRFLRLNNPRDGPDGLTSETANANSGRASVDSQTSSMLRVLVIVSASAFLAQVALTLALEEDWRGALPRALLHAFVLSTAVFFALLRALVRPFSRHEQELVASQRNLEDRVAERTSELARFASILDATPDLAATADSSLRMLWLNAGGRQMLALAPRDEVRGMDVLSGYPARVHAAMREAFQRASEAGSWQGDGVLLSRTGDEIPVSQVILSHRAADGTVDFFSTIARDISDRERAEAEVERANTDLRSALDRVEEQRREMTMLSEMSDLVQAAVDNREVFAIIGRYSQALLQDTMGAVYVHSASRNDLECSLGWGGIPGTSTEQVFGPNDCWALRRGRPHAGGRGTSAPTCAHMDPAPGAFTLCVPMMAHGDVVGLLHIRQPEPIDPRLPMAIADQVGLAIANLKLRDTLRSQSIRDPVTALFNRRFFEETLERELRRAVRGQQSLGLVLIDLDRFKLFNDTHGHQAGDIVLQEFGAFLARSVRGGDVACRYGGEEFVLVLPESSLADTAARADALRAELRSLRLMFAGQPLGPVTFSAGVAAYPEHGSTMQDLMRLADAALYRAKDAGRDRVVVAEGAPALGERIA